MAIDELIAKLESAKEGSRELDGEIYTTVVNTAYELTRRVPGECQYKAGGHPFGCEHYTTSIDAALTLVPEELKPGWPLNWSVSLLFAPDESWATAKVFSYVGHEWVSERATTPALALCCAALRARGAK